MSPRPDISSVLEPGEELLWTGHPLPGRRVPARAGILAALAFAATLLVVAAAWYLALFRGHIPAWNRAVFGLVTLAALLSYVGLRVTILDRRRARARDRRTAYAITSRRAVAVTGPYTAEVPLGPGARLSHADDTVTIASQTGSVRFERLDDAASARAILEARIEGTS